MKQSHLLLASVLLLVLSLLACSGGDNPTAPPEEPSVLGSTHSSLSYSVPERAVTMPDPKTITFTNNSEDTMHCRISCSDTWLILTRSAFTLAPDSSVTCDVRITIDTLHIGTYRDTIWIRDSETDEGVRRIPAKLSIVKNETYLEVDEPDMNTEYLGVHNGDHEYKITCTWKMICHSNGGNSCTVFEYAVFSGNALYRDVNVLMRPNLPTGQQVTGTTTFYVYSAQAPPLRIAFYVRIGYRALDKEDYLRIDYSY